MPNNYASIKNNIMDEVSNGENWLNIGHSKYKVGQLTVHARYCSTNMNSEPPKEELKAKVCQEIDRRAAMTE